MTQAPYVLVPASYQLATDSGCVELHIAYDNGRQLDILLEPFQAARLGLEMRHAAADLIRERT